MKVFLGTSFAHRNYIIFLYLEANTHMHLHMTFIYYSYFSAVLKSSLKESFLNYLIE